MNEGFLPSVNLDWNRSSKKILVKCRQCGWELEYFIQDTLPEICPECMNAKEAQLEVTDQEGKIIF